MLDASVRVPVDEAPQVLVFRDQVIQTLFYALPAVPRPAADERGQPNVSLLVYGKKRGDALQVSGGQLNVVTSLALNDDEKASVHTALVRLLEAEIPQAPGAPPPLPSVLPPEWLSATVEVELVDGSRVEGTPSMMGDNECALALTLSGAQAQQLQKEWERGRAGIVARYRGAISTVRESSASWRNTSQSTESDQFRSMTVDTDTGLDFRGVSAVELPIVLEGPIEIVDQDLRNQIQVVGL
jgi:hypothetical protein